MDELLGIVFRIGKALVLGSLMYFSLRVLHFSVGASFFFALVPALLGSLNIMTGTAFGLTGIVFILASGSVLLKEANINLSIDDGIKFLHSFSSERKSGASQEGQSQSKSGAP